MSSTPREDSVVSCSPSRNRSGSSSRGQRRKGKRTRSKERSLSAPLNEEERKALETILCSTCKQKYIVEDIVICAQCAFESGEKCLKFMDHIWEYNCESVKLTSIREVNPDILHCLGCFWRNESHASHRSSMIFYFDLLKKNLARSCMKEAKKKFLKFYHIRHGENREINELSSLEPTIQACKSLKEVYRKQEKFEETIDQMVKELKVMEERQDDFWMEFTSLREEHAHKFEDMLKRMQNFDNPEPESDANEAVMEEQGEKGTFVL